MCFAATIAMCDERLSPVIGAFGRLLVSKFAARGSKIEADHLAKIVTADVERMTTDSFLWAQRWLAEFREGRKDSYMVVLFADHCIKQFDSFRHVVEATIRD
jgi:mannose-1-phosphate guanylyltransferase